MPAEQLAGALLGLLRADYPEPEDVSDDGRMRNAQNLERQSGERPAPRTRPERGFTASEGDGVWFRINVGRERNADPKWILPLLCRVGKITRNEIGPIRIFANETKVEIAGHAAEAFAQSIRTMTETQVQIEPSTPPNASDNIHPARARRDDGQRADRAPREKRDFGDRPPRAKRGFGDRPPRDPRTDFKRSGREEARAARHQQRDHEQAKLNADPVYAALAPSEPAQHKGPPPAHPSGLNRKQRRDAARAAGEIPAVTPEAVKRSWSPEADSRPQRMERRNRPQHADARHAERLGRDDQRGEGFKPRGPKGAKPFKPRGDKPFSGKSFSGKPGGKFKGKPAGKRDWRG
jgi:ATP-dependent RNA helicase DeaD